MHIKTLTAASVVTLVAVLGSTTPAHAQSSTKPTSPTTQANQPGATSESPTTPPTHPTERGKPSTSAATSKDEGTTTGSPSDKAKGGSKSEAMQTCKNLTGEQARADCMKKAGKDKGMGADKPSGM